MNPEVHVLNKLLNQINYELYEKRTSKRKVLNTLNGVVIMEIYGNSYYYFLL
jgi:hypothetical protein